MKEVAKLSGWCLLHVVLFLTVFLGVSRPAKPYELPFDIPPEPVTKCSLQRQAAATCRIWNSTGEQGSGCVFEITGKNVYVLTNAHVVDAGDTVQCEFWWGGHQSKKLSGRVSARANEDVCDAAIVIVDVASFGGRLPVAIPFAPRGTQLCQGQTISWMGCPGNEWATAVVGHAAGIFPSDSGGRFVFRPAPRDGRSGSAVLNADGTAIVGLIHARTLDDQYGIAFSTEALYTAFSSQEKDAQCPPGQQCDPNRGGGVRRVLPGPNEWPRRIPRGIMGLNGGQPQQRQPAPQGGGVYPTLPQIQPAPAVTVDLSGVESKLDKLEGSISMLVEELRAANPPPAAEAPLPVVPPVPVAPVEPDPPAITADDLEARDEALLTKWREEQAKAALPPVPEPPVMVGPFPVEKITETVTEGADAAIEAKGTFIERSKVGIATIADKQTEEGSLSDIALYALLAAILGPWVAKVVFPFTRWGKNKAFGALANVLDPDHQNTPQEDRVKENFRTLLVPANTPRESKGV